MAQHRPWPDNTTPTTVAPDAPGQAAVGSLPLDQCCDALINSQDEVMMGIDEAGRGPTLGPMVYGSAFCRVEDEARLKAMGFADSKTLTEAKRESLWAELQSVGFIGWRIRVLHAQEISSAMLRRFKPYNLNAMSHDAAIGLVRQVLELGVNLRYLYVDTVGDPDVYRMKLESIFPNLQITVAKKADSIYPIVSAASICAKVPRDTILAAWRFNHGGMCSDYAWGCGYPGDKETVRWMKENMHPLFGWPNVCRFSWGPALEVLQKNPRDHGAVEVRWPDDKMPEQAQQRDAMELFLGKRKRAPAHRHKIFSEAGLVPVESW